MRDETCRIFLNTRGTNETEVSPELVNFLHYLEDTTDSYVAQTQDEKINMLHHKVQALKKSRKWENKYMTLQEYLDDTIQAAVEEAVEKAVEKAVEEAEEKAFEKSREQISRLSELMRKEGKVQQFLDAITDAVLLEQLFQEYNI